MEAFSNKWFILYYIALGVLAAAGGLYFVLRTRHFRNYLEHHANTGNPPVAIRKVLKYLFLFTIPGLILSFMPFSWIELLFSLWSLLLVYIVGLQLVRWETVGKVFIDQPAATDKYIRIGGVIMLTVSLVMFMLSFLAINRSNLL